MHKSTLDITHVTLDTTMPSQVSVCNNEELKVYGLGTRLIVTCSVYFYAAILIIIPIVIGSEIAPFPR